MCDVLATPCIANSMLLLQPGPSVEHLAEQLNTYVVPFVLKHHVIVAFLQPGPSVEHLAERQRMEEAAMPLMLDAMWAANVLDIEGTLRAVCRKVGRPTASNKSILLHQRRLLLNASPKNLLDTALHDNDDHDDGDGDDGPVLLWLLSLYDQRINASCSKYCRRACCQHMPDLNLQLSCKNDHRRPLLGSRERLVDWPWKALCVLSAKSVALLKLRSASQPYFCSSVTYGPASSWTPSPPHGALAYL